MTTEEMKKQIKSNYGVLNKLFRNRNKPDKYMRDLQHETWAMKKILKELKEEN